VVERGKVAAAHHLFDVCRTLFGFALERDLIEFNPCDRLKRSSVVGHKPFRERTLNDDELRALWRAARRLNYPFGPAYQLLTLTGARLNEVAGAHWSEFDLERKIWTIPAARFKTGQQHQLPLPDDALTLLKALPRWRRGDCVFSSTYGDKSISGWTKAKQRLDRHMLRTLRALARLRGDDPAVVTLTPFVNHDIRRSVRTGLSRLRIPDHIAEQSIGHSRKGMARIYDQHKFSTEIREALTAWQNLLRSITRPATDSNVVPLRAGA
jgi:integrase